MTRPPSNECLICNRPCYGRYCRKHFEKNHYGTLSVKKVKKRYYDKMKIEYPGKNPFI